MHILGLALLAWAGAELVGGNGFIAAFAAGLTLGNTARSVRTCLSELAEAEGQLLTLLSFLVFGAVMVGPALDALTPSVTLYVVAGLGRSTHPARLIHPTEAKICKNAGAAP